MYDDVTLREGHKSKKAKPNPYSEMKYLHGLHRQLSQIVTNAMTGDLTEIDPLQYVPGPDTVIPGGSTRTALNISVNVYKWGANSELCGSFDIANFSILVPISEYFPSYNETISSHQNLEEDVNKCIGEFPSSFAKAATEFLNNHTLIPKLRNIVDRQIDKFFAFDVPTAGYYVNERLRERAKRVFGILRPLDPSDDEIKAMTDIETREKLTLQYRFAIKPCIAKSILAECEKWQTNPTPKSCSMKAITTKRGVVCIALNFCIDINQIDWDSKIHEAVSNAMGGGDGLADDSGANALGSEDNDGGD